MHAIPGAPEHDHGAISAGFSCSITHLRLAAPSPGRRTTSLLTPSLPDQPSGFGRVALSRLKIGHDLGEQVVQRPRGASGEPLDGVGDLGRVAVGPRAAIVLVQADQCARGRYSATI